MKKLVPVIGIAALLAVAGFTPTPTTSSASC